MPEYRYNIITNRHVIIATERGKRPHDFSHTGNTDIPVAASQLSSFDDKCPFCVGNEHMTPPESYAVRSEGTKPNSPGWQVRVIPNKYPALKQVDSDTIIDKVDTINNAVSKGSLHAEAAGVHEVVIQSPAHNKSFAQISTTQAGLVLKTIRQRYIFHSQQQYSQYVCIFCNHGPGSGASLLHPHFQIMALNHVPSRILNDIKYWQQFKDAQGISVFTTYLKQEVEKPQRIIAVNKHFAALCPYASMCPMEVYFIPISEWADFADITDEMITALSEIMQQVLVRLNDVASDIAYNIVFHTHGMIANKYRKLVGITQMSASAGRFYVQLYPRLATPGGFELASAVYINTMVPQQAADFYRNGKSIDKEQLEILNEGIDRDKREQKSKQENQRGNV